MKKIKEKEAQYLTQAYREVLEADSMDAEAKIDTMKRLLNEIRESSLCEPIYAECCRDDLEYKYEKEGKNSVSGDTARSNGNNYSDLAGELFDAVMGNYGRIRDLINDV